MLERIRRPQKRIPLNRAVIYSMGIMACGLITGVGVKLMDIYTAHLGNIFSQMSVWIFLCSVLAVYSSTPRRAAVNVFLFCVPSVYKGEHGFPEQATSMSAFSSSSYVQ